MSVNVQPRCFILSLFIRDDGERLLLGSGAYEFQEKQQHFVANAMVSDTVDVQGTDGTLLAGQVRRASSQSFDGYVGDATSTKVEIEQYRREFIEYFAKNHFYSVVYVFSDGTAIKRQRGFVVDAPEVKELFQIHPEYHVALNFEDVNYYEYNEDEAGQELYSQMFKIARTDSQQGGLMWDSYGAIMLPFDATQKTVSGTTISINDALSLAPIDIQIQGDTEQDGTPTPTTPVPIETVTGLQTVTISDGGSSQRTVEVNLGKNLFDMGSSLNDYFRTVANGTKLDYNGSMAFTTATFSESSITFDAYTPGNVYPWTSKWVKLEKNTDYTISIETDGPQLRVCGFSSMDDGTTGAYIANAYVNASTKTSSFNSGNYDYYLVSIYPSAGGKTISNIQIEKGSTATDYAPYFTPIELCKIGDYQDYIYKDSGKWYLHKETGRATFDGTEAWFSGTGSFYSLAKDNAKTTLLKLSIYSTEPISTTFVNGGSGALQQGLFYLGTSNINMNYDNSNQNLNVFTSWLANGLTKLYAPLKTATDTEITNTEVLAGLNQLGGGSLYAGTNNIVVTSEDLPGTLQFTYSTSGGDDPGGFEWETGGGGGLVSVTVDSIADVYPLITINGPATNPTLENLTTSTTMSYVGTIAEGQSLVIDTMAQTAKLSGTNVVQNLYGDWLFLSPGVNRIAYTTSNSDAPDAEGEFNEIVG